MKIAPETAIKLAMTDVLKAYVAQDPDEILPVERFICGGLAGGAAQVRPLHRQFSSETTTDNRSPLSVVDHLSHGGD